MFGLGKKKDSFVATQSTPNYRDVAPGYRTGNSATERNRPGRPVMRNVPTDVTGVKHQKYDSAPFTGGNYLHYDYAPYQTQPTNNQQRQYGYPRPGIDLIPPDATYGLDNGYEGSSQDRVQAPFAINNVPKNMAARPSELIQDYGRPHYRPPLSYYLSQKTPVGYNPEMQFAHQLTTGLTPYAPARDYPRSYNGWTHREYFTDTGQVPNSPPSAPAQKQRRTQKESAPPQLQASPGGLVLAAYTNVQRNININLVDMYKGAKAPTSSSYSGLCQ